MTKLCIYENMAKELNVVNTQKLILKSKYTKKIEMKSIINTQTLSASARIVQVMKWTLEVRISYPKGLEVISNLNLSTSQGLFTT